jgi:hypothetical protein
LYEAKKAIARTESPEWVRKIIEMGGYRQVG